MGGGNYMLNSECFVCAITYKNNYVLTLTEEQYFSITRAK